MALKKNGKWMDVMAWHAEYGLESLMLSGVRRRE